MINTRGREKYKMRREIPAVVLMEDCSNRGTGCCKLVTDDKKITIPCNKFKNYIVYLCQQRLTVCKSGQSKLTAIWREKATLWIKPGSTVKQHLKLFYRLFFQASHCHIICAEIIKRASEKNKCIKWNLCVRLSTWAFSQAFEAFLCSDFSFLCRPRLLFYPNELAAGPKEALTAWQWKSRGWHLFAVLTPAC